MFKYAQKTGLYLNFVDFIKIIRSFVKKLNLRESLEVRGVEGLERKEEFNDWEGKGKGRMVGGR